MITDSGAIVIKMCCSGAENIIPGESRYIRQRRQRRNRSSEQGFRHREQEGQDRLALTCIDLVQKKDGLTS